MRLYGYTSTSRKRNEAESFAFSNESDGIKKVVLHIHWYDADDHYYMNSGAYDHEEEILLNDGTAFRVLSVLDEKYNLYEIYGFEEQAKVLNGSKCVITNKD